MTPGAGGIVVPLSSSTGVALATQGFTAPNVTLTLALNSAPTSGEQLTLINNTAASSSPINGSFANLSQGGTISAAFGPTTYYFEGNYAGGDGNDLVLTNEVTPTVRGFSSSSPTSGSTGGGTTVTITGTGFTGATAVDFGGLAGTGVTVNSATQITVTSPRGSAGSAAVTVVTPAGVSSPSPTPFTYLAAPTVGTISPAVGPLAGNTPVTITGTNLAGTMAVNFGAGTTPVTSFTSDTDTQIVLNSPRGSAGPVDVQVVTPGGTSSVNSPADQFTYMAAPTVTRISPTAGPLASGTTVTIGGTNLAGATAVNFGNTPATSFTVDATGTYITATNPGAARAPRWT